MRKLIWLTALVPVAACSTTPAPAPLESPPSELSADQPAGSCTSNGLERFVGQSATAETEAQLKAASGATLVRMVGPDMSVTMDFRPDRLTVRYDANRRILSAACG
jgi:hypothetical protein